MQLDKYAGVIRLVIAKNAGKSPEEVTSEILKSIEIAQMIAGEVPTQANVSMETLRIGRGEIALADTAPVREAAPRRGAVLISAAPPVAGAGDDTDTEDDVDYYESKPGKGDGANRLQVKLQELLPPEMTIQVPGIEKPLTLVRGIGSPGIRFCHINYSILGGDLGPRVTVMTSQKVIDKYKILTDILEQAGSMYSAEKRVITPRATRPEPPPSQQDLDAMMARERRSTNPDNPLSGLSQDEAKSASEDAAYFNSQGRSNPRWQ